MTKKKDVKKLLDINIKEVENGFTVRVTEYAHGNYVYEENGKSYVFINGKDIVSFIEKLV